jgi:uncharacterized protein (TIGR02646 family)
VSRFNRTNPAPIVKGGYGAFRPYVRDDFERCCAYCYLHERYAGGEEGFQLDHFYPKDPALFPARGNDFYNLYWTCMPCNRKKWNQWPPYQVLDHGICFVDLCNDDFDQHYRLRTDGKLEPLTPSAAYTIAAIRLNREHLVKIRSLLLKQNRALDQEPG